jgi:hypothetical protein
MASLASARPDARAARARHRPCLARAVSVGNGIEGNVAIIRRYISALVRDVTSFVESIVDRVIEIVRSVVAEIAEPLLRPPRSRRSGTSSKKVLHYDPLRGVRSRRRPRRSSPTSCA